MNFFIFFKLLIFYLKFIGEMTIATGSAPMITIEAEMRSGNKIVTKLTGLEVKLNIIFLIIIIIYFNRFMDLILIIVLKNFKKSIIFINLSNFINICFISIDLLVVQLLVQIQYVQKMLRLLYR